MISKTKGGLTILKGLNGHESLYIDSDRIDDCIEYLKNNNLRFITISKYHGYKAESIDFLIELKDFLEGIAVLDVFDDTTVVNELHDLKHLSILDNGKTIIDLKNFPKLEWCSIMTFSERIKGLDTCRNLKTLNIVRFHPKIKDISILPVLDKLEEFSLLQTNVTSLDGIAQFKGLKKLEISYAPKLESIAALKNLFGTLKEVEFDKCKKVTDFEILGELHFLKKIRLSDSGTVKSLAFIQNLPLLEFITFVGTNVLDGNMNYCERVKNVGFDNKKHYSPKMEHFKSRNQV